MANMDIDTLTNDDLSWLLENFRKLASNGNQVFFDGFCNIERVTLCRTENTEIADYRYDHLVESIAELTKIVDELRADKPDTHPRLRFLLELLTILIVEYERRGGSTATH